MTWTDDQINDWIGRVYSGEISVYALPKDLYEDIRDYLQSAVDTGFGVTSTSLNSLTVPYQEVYIRLQNSQSVFSAAKTFQQIKDMQRFLFTPDGFKAPFSDFNKAARVIFDEYNVNWLEAEYNTSISRAYAAEEWLEIEDTKDALPFLEYQTVGDGNVRPEHAELDGIVRPVDDPIWNTIFPPNGWNCRCIARRVSGGKMKEFREDQKKAMSEVPKLFRNNPAKMGYIFDPAAHPYFKVENKYKELKIDNFGLPL